MMPRTHFLSASKAPAPEPWTSLSSVLYFALNISATYRGENICRAHRSLRIDDHSVRPGVRKRFTQWIPSQPQPERERCLIHGQKRF